jgi:hypothetical protein
MRCRVVYHFDFRSQGNVLRLLCPRLDTVCIYVIQDAHSGLILLQRLLGTRALHIIRVRVLTPVFGIVMFDSAFSAPRCPLEQRAHTDHQVLSNNDEKIVILR